MATFLGTQLKFIDLTTRIEWNKERLALTLYCQLTH